jgi:hypothetical protein
MIRAVALAVLIAPFFSGLSDAKRPSYPYYEHDVALRHEVKPHRRRIPVEGVLSGFNQLRLTLTVSPVGDVVDVRAIGNDETMKFWPQLKGEVNQWKFTPFVKHGKAVTAEVEEYVDVVPPERLPANHVAAPIIRQDSKITIKLERGGCYGTCPIYTVAVSTDGIAFEGKKFVAATGKHTDAVAADEVRNLAKKFVTADFYSMDDRYIAGVTDNPMYILYIAIDGHTKEVEDYVGFEVGMPAVITELENDVDALANTSQWIGPSTAPAMKASQIKRLLWENRAYDWSSVRHRQQRQEGSGPH